MVDNRVHPLVDIVVPPFFKGPDAVGPQGIVEVDFIERIFIPINSIESTIGPTPSGTVVQRPTDYLKRLWLVCAKKTNFLEGIPRNLSDMLLPLSLLC